MNPTEILPIVFIVVLLVLAIVIALVGIQLFLTLKDVRVTLKKTNKLVDNADGKLDMLVTPLNTLSDLAVGVGSGLKAFESFGHWLSAHKKSKE
ncbi:MAG: hypothetical protein LBG64_02765 [Pseudomonadales bacterium]|jgi:uncharacterized protein YoxC|nr:hypothetical protein [Pseudomonadales bacterium]